MGKSNHSSNQAGFHVTVIKVSQIRRTWEQQSDLSCWLAHGTSNVGGMGEVQSFFPFHTMGTTIPAKLQTEHFVNLHREQIQQSRVEPFVSSSPRLFHTCAICFPLLLLLLWNDLHEKKTSDYYFSVSFYSNSAAYLKRAHLGPLRLCSLQFKKYILFL